MFFLVPLATCAKFRRNLKKINLSTIRKTNSAIRVYPRPNHARFISYAKASMSTVTASSCQGLGPRRDTKTRLGARAEHVVGEEGDVCSSDSFSTLVRTTVTNPVNFIKHSCFSSNLAHLHETWQMLVLDCGAKS